MDLSRFALFVSLDPKNPVPVTRFGPGTLIAADRDGRNIRYRPDEVVAITREEMAQYGREYGRALRSGSLIERTEADYRAFLKAQEDAEKKRGEEVERRKAEAKRKAEEEAKRVEAERVEAERKAAEAKAAEEAQKAAEQAKAAEEAAPKATESPADTAPQAETPAPAPAPAPAAAPKSTGKGKKGVTDGS